MADDKSQWDMAEMNMNKDARAKVRSVMWRNTGKPVAVLMWGLTLLTSAAVAQTDDDQTRQETMIFSPDGKPVMVFNDADKGQIVVKKKVNDQWEMVGKPLPVNSAGAVSIAFSPRDGQPYVAYRDNRSGRIEVKGMVSDGKWQNLAKDGGIAAGQTQSVSLDFSPKGEAFVVYGSDSGAGIRRLEKTGKWQELDSQGLNAGKPEVMALQFSPKGEPYVAYRNGNSGRAEVKKLGVQGWDMLGGSVSSVNADNISLSFSQRGEPYVLYRDSKTGRAQVNQFDVKQVKWHAIGGNVNAGNEQVRDASLAFSPNNDAYVTYRRADGSTVMKRYEHGKWVVTDEQITSQ